VSYGSLTVEISSINFAFSLSKNPGSLGDESNAVDDLARDIVGCMQWSLTILRRRVRRTRLSTCFDTDDRGKVGFSVFGVGVVPLKKLTTPSSSSLSLLLECNCYHTLSSPSSFLPSLA
jgi:hypothetical protein